MEEIVEWKTNCVEIKDLILLPAFSEKSSKISAFHISHVNTEYACYSFKNNNFEK